MDSSVKNKVLRKAERFFLNLANKVRQKLESSSNLKLVDLTPTDSAEDCETYFESIDQGMRNQNVKNIALTGPYGSGKSSIIKSYEKKRLGVYKLLNISLASFKEDGKQLNEEQKEAQDKSIERSIIQQMLYGADASKLIHSRFKRIKVTQSSTAALISFTFLIWFITSFFLLSIDSINLLTSYTFFSFEVFCLIYFLAVPTLLFYDFLKLKSGFSFKKLSLKNLELETGELTESSILNRYLDEIIYFFQVSKYNLVVIEDLDRFGSPEIFVKLREINKLINDNDKTTGEIKFLYALKDDMFIHKNRAKFFDLIIPVIPIVNSNNSLDKILNTRLNSIDSNVYENLRGSSFLRDVSNYLDDMRLIHNIFNEFEVYRELLNVDVDNSIKLFSLIIFKNMYPNDFELLHHGDGFFKTLCNKKNELIKDRLKGIDSKIVELEASIKALEAEELASYEELIAIYLKVLSENNNNAYAYQEKNQVKYFSSIKTIDEFLSLFESRKVLYNHGGTFHFNSRFSDFEEKLAFKHSFSERMKNIENKEKRRKYSLINEVGELRTLSSKINGFKLSDLLKEKPEIFDEHSHKWKKITNFGLLRYLVFEGHLDESYYLYISKFYEGRKTLNDHAFIMAVRSYSSIDLFHQIDNPKEICSELRVEDFSTKYILNINLIDYLIMSKSYSKLRLVYGYIDEHLEQTEDFIINYFINGLYVEHFLNGLAKFNKKFLVDVLDKGLSNDYVGCIINSVDNEYMVSSMNVDYRLTEFLGGNLKSIIDSKVSGSLDMDLVKLLDVKVSDISGLIGYKSWFNFIIDNSCYEINLDNLACIILDGRDLSDINLINYTSIMKSNFSSVKKYILINLSEYYEKILKPNFEKNTNESEESVVKLLESSVLLESQKSLLIESLNFQIKNITHVHESYWLKLVSNFKVLASWSNINQLLVNNTLDNEQLLNFLNVDYFADGLSQADWEDDLTQEEVIKIIDLIIYAEQLSDDSYKKLISKFPVQRNMFPTHLSDSKLKLLVDYQVVELNAETYEEIMNCSFIITFIINNIDSFMKLRLEVYVSDDLIVSLLKSEISRNYKIDLLYDLVSFDDDKDLAKEVANLIFFGNADTNKINANILIWVTYGTKHIETSLRLICMLFDRWDEEEVMGILSNIDEPYSNISLYRKKPKIGNTALDIELAKLLDSKNYISSFKIEDNGVRIHTKQHK